MKRKFRSFTDAREFVRKLKLKNRTEWQSYTKTSNKPKDIPSYPNETYEKEWKSVGDWLGTGRVASQNISYRSFNDAREFVKKLKLKNVDEWRSYCKTSNKPKDIPAVPPQTYENKGWIGYSDWLGTGTISNTLRSKSFPSFNDAKNEVQKIAKKYNLKNQPDWIKAYRDGKIPKHLPAKPWKTYSKKRIK